MRGSPRQLLLESTGFELQLLCLKQGPLRLQLQNVGLLCKAPGLIMQPPGFVSLPSRLPLFCLANLKQNILPRDLYLVVRRRGRPTASLRSCSPVTLTMHAEANTRRSNDRVLLSQGLRFGVVTSGRARNLVDLPSKLHKGVTCSLCVRELSLMSLLLFVLPDALEAHWLFRPYITVFIGVAQYLHCLRKLGASSSLPAFAPTKSSCGLILFSLSPSFAVFVILCLVVEELHQRDVADDAVGVVD